MLRCGDYDVVELWRGTLTYRARQSEGPDEMALPRCLPRVRSTAVLGFEAKYLVEQCAYTSILDREMCRCYLVMSA